MVWPQAFLWLAVLCSFHVGIGSPVGQSNTPFASAPSNSTTTSTNASKFQACTGNNVSLVVDASSEAREDLLVWLAKDTVRVVFIYFDLVVGSLVYHPGTCPKFNDGKRAGDAQTPLAWALTSSATSGANEPHTLADAYLTLPFSYPRIYSLGILNGHYVGYMYHEQYRMKMVVRDDDGCWSKLDKDLKAVEMGAAVQSFLRNSTFEVQHEIDSKNTGISKWRLCYSDPSEYDLPASTSLLIARTPAYVCQEKGGSYEKLEQGVFLRGLRIFFPMLTIGMFVLQLLAVRKGIHLFRAWGEEDKHLHERNEQLILADDFFSMSKIPVQATVGELLSSECVLGRQAFDHFKKLVLCFGVFTVLGLWPVINLLILTPVSWLPDTAFTTAVYRSETCWPYFSCGTYFFPGWEKKTNFSRQTFLSGFIVANYASGGVVLAFIICVYFVCSSKQKQHAVFFLNTFQYASAFMVDWALCLFLNILVFLRITLQYPSLPYYRRWYALCPEKIDKDKESWSCKNIRERTGLPLSKKAVFAQLIFWLLLLPIFVVIATAGLVKHICLPLLRICPSEKLISLVFRFMFFLSFIIFFYIQSSELLAFFLLSSVSLYVTYPLPTLITVSWMLALAVEAQNLLHEYRQPLLASRKPFVKKLKEITEEFVEADGNKSGGLSIRSVDRDGHKVDWKKFTKKLDQLWLKTYLCLWPAETASESEDFHGVETNILLTWLDVRNHKEVRSSKALLGLQKILLARLFKGVLYLFFLVVLFLSAVWLLLAFDSLWKNTNPKDTNTLLLSFLVVPFYTMVRTRFSTSSLTENQKEFLKRAFDVELESCFKESLVGHVSAMLFDIKTPLERHSTKLH